jgi:hypothetical protein
MKSNAPARFVRRCAASHVAAARVRGVSLIFALLGLAAVSLAAVALVRAVHGGSLVIGNVGFKQDTTRAADRATEIARGWLTGASNNLAANGAPGTGYYATANANIDATGQRTGTKIAWEGTTCSGTCLQPSSEMTLNGGNVRAQYLITRLCPNVGAVDNANACAQPAKLATDTSLIRGSIDYGDYERLNAKAQQAPYYRIIVRTVGGRNTISFTETIVH